jgi:glycosyltransferase involved in cell wall biosynthesis
VRLAIVETAPFGGLLHYTAQLGDALAGRGHEVDLLVPRDNELLERRAQGEQATMRAVLTPPTTSRMAAGGPALVRRARVAWRLVRAWSRVLREARRYEVVVVDVDIDLSLVAAFTLALAYLPGGPRVVVIAHSVRPLNRWGGESHYVSSPLLRGLLTRVYRRAQSVVVHGERSRQAFEEAWPGSARVVVIAHGDEELFLSGEPPADATEPRALFFGVWRKVKGLPVLMEAFDLLAARRSEARLTIAGAPVPADLDPAPIEAWAARHPDAVELRPGYIELEDVPELFGAARVVVVPYETAFQSGVVHVALTFGRALVATDVGDLPEGVGDAGLLVAPSDPQALAAAIERVLFEPGLAERLGEAARARAGEHASWAQVAEQFEPALR